MVLPRRASSITGRLPLAAPAPKPGSEVLEPGTVTVRESPDPTEEGPRAVHEESEPEGSERIASRLGSLKKGVVGCRLPKCRPTPRTLAGKGPMG